MRHTGLLMLAALSLFVGCATGIETVEVDPPISIPIPGEGMYYQLNAPVNTELVVSIGNDLFTIIEYSNINGYWVNYDKAHFPIKNQSGTWRATHRREDSGALVFTSFSFESGDVGIALDREGVPVGQYPVVEVDGLTPYREFSMYADRPFFRWIPEIEEAYSVRFGGYQEGYLLFDIYKQQDANVSEVIQVVKVQEGQIEEGVFIKDVLITGRMVAGGLFEFSLKPVRNPLPPNPAKYAQQFSE